MEKQCPDCNKMYDDAYSLTICPHNNLMSPEDSERKDLALKLLSRLVRFAHEPSTTAARHVTAVTGNGMVWIEGMVGEFHPDLFVLIPMQKFFRRFLVEKEYVESFTSRGEVVPPWVVGMPYEVRDGVPGYWVPCEPDDPGAVEWHPKTDENTPK